MFALSKRDSQPSGPSPVDPTLIIICVMSILAVSLLGLVIVAWRIWLRRRRYERQQRYLQERTLVDLEATAPSKLEKMVYDENTHSRAHSTFTGVTPLSPASTRAPSVWSRSRSGSTAQRQPSAGDLVRSPTAASTSSWEEVRVEDMIAAAAAPPASPPVASPLSPARPTYARPRAGSRGVVPASNPPSNKSSHADLRDLRQEPRTSVASTRGLPRAAVIPRPVLAVDIPAPAPARHSSRVVMPRF